MTTGLKRRVDAGQLHGPQSRPCGCGLRPRTSLDGDPAGAMTAAADRDTGHWAERGLLCSMQAILTAVLRGPCANFVTTLCRLTVWTHQKQCLLGHGIRQNISAHKLGVFTRHRPFWYQGHTFTNLFLSLSCFSSHFTFLIEFTGWRCGWNCTGSSVYWFSGCWLLVLSEEKVINVNKSSNKVIKSNKMLINVSYA